MHEIVIRGLAVVVGFLHFCASSTQRQILARTHARKQLCKERLVGQKGISHGLIAFIVRYSFSSVRWMRFMLILFHYHRCWKCKLLGWKINVLISLLTGKYSSGFDQVFLLCSELRMWFSWSWILKI